MQNTLRPPHYASSFTVHPERNIDVSSPPVKDTYSRDLVNPVSVEHVSHSLPAPHHNHEHSTHPHTTHQFYNQTEQKDGTQAPIAVDPQLGDDVERTDSSHRYAEAFAHHSVQLGKQSIAEETIHDSAPNTAHQSDHNHGTAEEQVEAGRQSDPAADPASEETAASKGNDVEQHHAFEVGGDNSSTFLEDRLSRDPANFATFNEQTALNYFHLHKTGGVSFKERMFDFFMMHEKVNSRGQKARVVDTCHISGNARPALGIEAQWSCDWSELEIMPEKERNKIDVIVGHQYWEKGAGYWLPNRDLRCFTVMRHPLHRKISFFYHFFVRNAGRSEHSVSKDELIQFVLGKKMPNSPLVRDAGPGYYASRLWSDGLSGYDKNHKFVVSDETAKDMVFNSIRRLRKNFVFIGLQTQEAASLCMLKKTVYEFATAHGFNNMDGLDGFGTQRERLNTGSYPLTGELLWEQMSEHQKEEFKRVERVDLAIYRESVKMFHEMVKRFGCEDLVVESNEDNIAW